MVEDKPVRRGILASLLRGLGKGFLWSFLLFFGLLSGGIYYALETFFTPQKVAPLVEAALSGALHREVHVGSARLLPWQGIRISDLRVLEREGFGGPDFIDCPAVVATHKWLSLLRGRIEIQQLKFWSPSLQIVRNSEGRWNVEDLAEGGGGKGRMAAEAAPIEAFSNIQIQDGALRYRDEKRGVLQEISRFSFKMDGSRLKERLPFAIGFEFVYKQGDKWLEGNLQAKGSLEGVGGGPPTEALKVDPLEIRLPGFQISVQGTARDPARPSVDLRWKSGALEPEVLSSFLPIPPQLRLPPFSGDVGLTIEDIRRFEVRSFRAETGSVALYANGKFDFTRKKPLIQVRLSTNLFSLDDVGRIWTPFAPYTLQGASRWSVDMNGSLGDFVLDKLLVTLRGAGAAWGGAKLSGLDLEFSSSGNLQNASLQVTGGTLEHEGQVVSGIQTASRLEGDVLWVDSFSANWRGVPVKLKAKVLEPFAPKKLSIQAALAPLPLDQLIDYFVSLARRGKKPLAPDWWEKLNWLRFFRQWLPREFPSLVGDLKVDRIDHPNIVGKDLKITYRLDGITKGMKNLRGSAVVDLGSGKVHDIPTLEQHPFLRVVFLPFATIQKMHQMGFFASNPLGDLPFDQIHGYYRFNGGAMDINHFYVKGPDFTATAEGNVDWVQERLVLHVVTRASKTGKGCPESLSDEKGRCTLAFFIEGPMLRPDVRLDLDKIKVGEIERFMQAGVEEGNREAAKLRKQLW